MCSFETPEMMKWGEYVFDHPPHRVPRATWLSPDAAWLPLALAVVEDAEFVLPPSCGTFCEWVDEFRALNAGTAATTTDPEVGDWVRWRATCVRPWRGSRHLAPPPGGRWVSDWGLRVFEKFPADDIDWRVWVETFVAPTLVSERQRSWVFPNTRDFLLADAWQHAFRRANRSLGDEPLYPPRTAVEPRSAEAPEEVIRRLDVHYSAVGAFAAHGREEVDAFLDAVDEHRDAPLLRPPPVDVLVQRRNDFEGWRAAFLFVNSVDGGSAAALSEPCAPCGVSTRRMTDDQRRAVRVAFVATLRRRDWQSPALFRRVLAGAVTGVDFAFPRIKCFVWHEWFAKWFVANKLLPGHWPAKRARVAPRAPRPAGAGQPVGAEEEAAVVDRRLLRLRYAWQSAIEPIAARRLEGDVAAEYLDVSWEWFAAIVQGGETADLVKRLDVLVVNGL